MLSVNSGLVWVLNLQELELTLILMICVSTTCIPGTHEDGVKSPEAGVKRVSCKLPRGCWELNPRGKKTFFMSYKKMSVSSVHIL